MYSREKAIELFNRLKEQGWEASYFSMYASYFVLAMVCVYIESKFGIKVILSWFQISLPVLIIFICYGIYIAGLKIFKSYVLWYIADQNRKNRESSK